VIGRRLAGVLALAIALPGAIIGRNDFRAGVARLWISGGVMPIRAERAVSPAYFWAFTIVNGLTVAAIVAASLLLLVLP
jgi:hypothetical protein